MSAQKLCKRRRKTFVDTVPASITCNSSSLSGLESYRVECSAYSRLHPNKVLVRAKPHPQLHQALRDRKLAAVPAG
jgi:hypothetical protein